MFGASVDENDRWQDDEWVCEEVRSLEHYPKGKHLISRPTNRPAIRCCHGGQASYNVRSDKSSEFFEIPLEPTGGICENKINQAL
jgi:hypothetical protein